MKKHSKKRSLYRAVILFALAVMICIGAAGASFAYMKEQSGAIVNLFAPATQYRLSYDLNSGSGSIEDAVYMGTPAETSHVFTVTDVVPENTENQVFLGWADTADAVQAVYQAGNSVTVSKDAPHKVLYAVWEEVIVGDPHDFRLEFDANVPSGVSGASVSVPAAVEKKNHYGDTCTFAIVNAVAADYNVDNTGLRFLGWALSEFGDVVYPCSAASPSVSVTVAPGTTRLYAVWGYDYYITYDRNAPAGAVVKYNLSDTSWQDDNMPITVMTDYATVSVSGEYVDSSYGYSREGHMLVGFAAQVNGKTPLQSVTIPRPGKNNALTVYAIWQTGSFALIYDANGSGTAPAASIINTAAVSHTFTVTSEKPTPGASTEAKFLGWSEDPDAAVPTYQAGDKITLSKNAPSKTLYAVWEYTYRLRFNAGNAKGDVPEDISFTTTDKSHSFVIPAEPTPERDEYFFDYWASSEARVEGEHRYYDAANYSREIILHADDTDVTLYARMAPTDGVTVEYFGNASGDYYAVNVPAIQRVNDNTQDFCSFTLSSQAPSRRNSNGDTIYIFKGWATSSGAKTPEYQPGDVIEVDGDVQNKINLYAVWQAYDRMRVKLFFNGGSYSKTTGSGCNAVTTIYTERDGDYEYVTPGSTSWSFKSLKFDYKNLGWSKDDYYIPKKADHSIAGFSYTVDDDGRISTDISIAESSLCSEGGVKGLKWQQDMEASNEQTVVVDKINPDGSVDRTLYVYIIWAKDAAKDKYVVKLDQNHSNSTANNVTESYTKAQVVNPGEDDQVINTSHSFTSSSFESSDIRDLANSRQSYKLLGFARSRDSAAAEYTVNGYTLQNSITVSQEDKDVVVGINGGEAGGNSYTLTLYSVWKTMHEFQLNFIDGTAKFYALDAQEEVTVSRHDFGALTIPSDSTTRDHLSKTGYTLLGFSRTPDATVPDYPISNRVFSTPIVVAEGGAGVKTTTDANGAKLSILDLYTVWGKQQIFELKLDYRGGLYSGSSTQTITSQKDVNETSHTWSSLSYIPTRTGFKFLGYAYSPDATEPVYTIASNTPSPAITVSVSDNEHVSHEERNGVSYHSMQLYAVWEPEQVFEYVIDLGDGYYYTSSGNRSSKISKASENQSIDIPSYTFTGPTYTSEYSWQPERTGYVIYGYGDTEGTTEITLPLAKRTGTSSNPYTFMFEDILVAEGNMGVTVNTDGGYRRITRTYYPVWGIELSYSDGSNLPETVVRLQPTEDDRTFEISPIIPTYKNYLFAGWADPSDRNTPKYGIDGYVGNSGANALDKTVTFNSSTGSKSLNAVWWQQYTLSYSANGGEENTTPGRESAYETLAYGTSSTNHNFIIGNNVPYRAGYKFLGWSTDDTATTAQLQPGDTFNVPGNVDGSITPVTLYAVWEEDAASYDLKPGQPTEETDPTDPTDPTESQDDGFSADETDPSEPTAGEPGISETVSTEPTGSTTPGDLPGDDPNARQTTPSEPLVDETASPAPSEGAGNAGEDSCEGGTGV